MAATVWERLLGQNAVDARHPVRSLARWPAWLLACTLKRPVEARFATGGLRMRLVPRLRRFGTTSLYIKRDYYEPELLAVARLIAPGAVVLDIGASFGVFSLFMAHFAGANGRVHAFEPGRFSYDQLAINLALNDAGRRVVAHHVAASDRAGELQLFHIGDSPVNFSMGGRAGTASEAVAARRVDSIVPADEQSRVGFIKIDVEGFERTALEGARAILERAKPTIMFEVSTDALSRQGETSDDIYGFLAALGYRFFLLDEDGRFVAVDGRPDGNIFASVADLTGA